MPVSFHPAFRAEIIEAIAYYDEESGSKSVGNRLFEEINEYVDKIEENPSRFHFVEGYSPLRRANLKVFPHNILYYQKGRGVRLTTFRHNKRHPRLGIQRL